MVRQWGALQAQLIIEVSHHQAVTARVAAHQHEYNRRHHHRQRAEDRSAAVS